MKKKQQVSKIASYELIPFFLVLIVIPLIVIARTYENGLSGYPWYSTNTSSYDFFLFWKSRLVMITGLAAALFLAFRIYDNLNRKIENKPLPILFWLPVIIYGFFVLASCIFSAHTDFAFWGSAEQFEGGLALLSYCVLACYGYYYVVTHDIEEKMMRWLTYGASIVSVIGAFQFAGLDFFRTDFAKGIITMLDAEMAGKNFEFNFELGRTYASLYNPNYIGSYVALLLPAVIVTLIISKKIWMKIIAGLGAFCLVLSLVGSESMTGYLAIFFTAILLFVMLLPLIRKYWKRFALIGAGALVVFLLLVVWKRDAFEYGVNKIFHPVANDYAVASITKDGDKGIKVATNKGKVIHIANTAADGTAFSFLDEEGSVIRSTYNTETGSLDLSGADYEGFSVMAGNITIDNKQYVGFRVSKDGRQWNFVIMDGVYRFYSIYGKPAEIRNIPSIGFEKSQHFASRRGFIWSRTLPLVGDHILLGSGPDTFVLEFPNDDFVGMVNNSYSGNMVTKPHNMYLQIAVQTGVISLIAFLTLFIAYFVNCIKLYWNRKFTTMSFIGLACMLGTFGYMITGLANDSSITVAPLFWLLIGMGAAINCKISSADKQETK